MRRFLRKVVPGGLAAAYLESEWSFAQVRGVHAPTICAFGKTPNTVVSVGADGAFLVSRFADGGECERVAFHRFIKSKEEEEFDVPPWEDPRTFGPGGPLHTPPKPPEPGQPFIDPKAGTISAKPPADLPTPQERDAPADAYSDAPAPPPAPPAPPPAPVPDVEYPDLGASIYHEAPSALPDEEATDEEDEPASPQVDLGQSIYHEARAPSESGELSN